VTFWDSVNAHPDWVFLIVFITLGAIVQIVMIMKDRP
jgi:hypothetical protein